MNYKQFKYLGVVLALSVSLTGCGVIGASTFEKIKTTDEVDMTNDTDILDDIVVGDDTGGDFSELYYIETPFDGAISHYLEINNYARAKTIQEQLYAKDVGTTHIVYNQQPGDTEGHTPEVTFSENSPLTPDEQVDKVESYVKVFVDMFGIDAQSADYDSMIEGIIHNVLSPEVLNQAEVNLISYITIDNEDFRMSVITSNMHDVDPNTYDEGLIEYDISFKYMSRG